MNEKSLRTLEFNKILEMLIGKCISAMGKEQAINLKPSTDISEINRMQDYTSESSGMILKKGSLPMGGIRDIRPQLKRVGVMGVLSVEELLAVGDFLYVCRKIASYGEKESKNDHFPLLDDMFACISLLPALEKEIARCIMPPDQVADDASQTLSNIRRGINVANARVREQLNNVIHSSSYKNMIQDSVITIRNDRYCVPIKQEYRTSFPGMIHDQSSTGATVFMEPMSVVNLNNQIKELRSKEKTEIEKILRELSQEVGQYAEVIEGNLEVLTNLDFVFAKGELSIAMNGSRPEFNSRGYINIRKGRHPLLSQDTVVPTNIYLGDEFTTLLITGPNTGGKTVTLKTLGLLTLMGQSGLHISAGDHSELAVFFNVFADIGDEQSIEQSLSTFSSHMSNIVNILSSITENSLVLLDELGAGTDPTEGAALAIAILEYLYKRRAITAVTTHYSELKVYALSTEGVENASCEFDVETLKPTYKLLIGIPGKSNAFEISRRLGLKEDIISSAKEVLSKEDERFEDVITDLEISKKSVIIEKERAEKFRMEAEKLKQEFETQKEKLNTQKEKILANAREEARKIYSDARDEADILLKEHKRGLKENRLVNDNSARQKLSEKVSENYGGLDFTPTAHIPIDKPLKQGDSVYVSTLNKSGVVVTVPDGAGNATISVGAMKMKIHISHLLQNPDTKTKPKFSKNVSRAVKAASVSTELDIRGMMVDEGIEKCDKYLDDAYLSNLPKATIIHGKGTGALRSAVQSHLKGHPHVKSYRLGTFGEGEDGVTIVEFL